jgi:hypothetical protein
MYFDAASGTYEHFLVEVTDDVAGLSDVGCREFIRSLQVRGKGHEKSMIYIYLFV